MSIISLMVSIVVFVIAVVIIVLIVQWGLEKTGFTIDPKLKTIIYLIIVLILIVVFLNFTGLWVWSGSRIR